MKKFNFSFAEAPPVYNFGISEMSDDLMTPKKPIEQPVKEKSPEKEKKFER